MNRYMIVIPAKNRSFVLKCDEGDGAKLETLQKLSLIHISEPTRH